MVTEGKLRRYQGKKTKELQHRNFTLWDKRSEEEITVDQLLKKGPGENNRSVASN
jgi:hypothetical protein